MSETKQVSAALVKAQRAFGPALKTHTNPAFRSKYADLSACVEAVIDALNSFGIALIQRNLPCESGVCVETVFIHESGESLSSGPLHVPAAKQDPQGYGSALTYARRYSLMAACGIAPEDDDGNAGSRKPADTPRIDMSPKARAERIKVGVAAGDAAGAALVLSQESQSVLDAIWQLLDERTITKLEAAWPKETA